jgi:Tol biopolymer transport system component
MSFRVVFLFALAALAFVESAAAAQLSRVSVDSSGAQADGDSGVAFFSRSGSIVVFVSAASNLVAGDTNGTSDIFLRDLATGTTARVSVATDGTEANGSSFLPSLSVDGRFVVFCSGATNLAAGDTNGEDDVFLRDLLTGTTERVSVSSAGQQSDGPGYTWPSISGDGRLVSFSSGATNLVEGDTNGLWDVFVRDRVLGTTDRVSVGPAGEEADGDSHQSPRLSEDGRFVAFGSAARNLLAVDSGPFDQVFVRDLAAGVNEIVSVNPTDEPGRGDSGGPQISANGDVVAFTSWAPDLVPDDKNWDQDVFLRDRMSASTQRVSVDSFGGQVLQISFLGGLSADGRCVTFTCADSGLVAGDFNDTSDAFIHDRSTGITERASINAATEEGDGPSQALGISSDGCLVLLSSRATNLVDGDDNGRQDVFLRDRGASAIAWSVYGAGLAGTLGVPHLTSRASPVLGRTLGIDGGNSSGEYDVGALFLGFEATSLPTWGGELVVVPAITQLIGLTPWGMSMVGPIPDDASLDGLELYLQIAELDAGAPHGIALTNGLELLLGR